MRRGIGPTASDHGATTVELAIVLPVLLLLLIGIIDVGLSLNAYVTVTNASREAANYAIVHPTAAPSAIASAALARSAPLVPARITVRATYYDGATFQPWPAAGLPESSPTPRGIPIRVEVSYPWSASTMLVGAFFNGGSLTLDARSTMETRW
jgi:hypothetical protein